MKNECISHSIPEIDALTSKKHKLRTLQKFLLGGVFSKLLDDSREGVIAVTSVCEVADYKNYKIALSAFWQKVGCTAQKLKFSINDFFSKYDQICMVRFTEEILNGKLHFLFSADN